MIDGGLILMLLGALVLGIPPSFDIRRWVSLEMIRPALRRAFPPPAPEQRLELLAVTAEAAIESAVLRRRQQRAFGRLRRN